jgi:outer membrane protein assembly factor BamB
MAGRVEDMVFTGFNKQVIALDKNTGNILWHWVCPKGVGYVSMLLTDDAHLIVSVNEYTYCLDPRTGEQRWFNELPGYGTGVTSLASLGKQTSAHILMASASDQEQSAADSPVITG